MKKIKCLSALLMCFAIISSSFFTQCNRISAEMIDVTPANTESTTQLNLQSKAAILMEADTGKVLYEQNADEILSPASITKIMTLLLIFDSLKEGKIHNDDIVTTSEYAKSMGGSQVFLEAGEQQTVETLIKCIIIASGNDASVTMAEFIAGSESEFVNRMNQKAAELGMTNTVFKDCCGLCDSMDHHTTARDVAIMSRVLITKYPEIQNYSKIWMEDITHVTAKGTSTFTLANTNKLLKQYQWTTGLKTGSTSLAKYCLSATASKDGVNLIAVIMGAPDYKVRFSEAITLLNYGYSIVQLYRDDNKDIQNKVAIKNGTKNSVGIRPESAFSYVCGKDEQISSISKKILMNKNIKAPLKKGDFIGEIQYYIGENQIGSIKICTTENAKKAHYVDYLKKVWYKYVM